MLGADRDLRGDDVVPECLLDGLERTEEVGALAVEHVHEDEPRQALLVRTLPEPVGVDLDAHHPLTTTTAASATRSEATVSAMKLGSPGVSIRLILRPS